jgi:hypothetical protein
MVTLVKEAGIPDWGGRLVLQLQQALAALSTPSVSIKNVSASGYVTAAPAAPDTSGNISLITTLTTPTIPSGTPTAGAGVGNVTGNNGRMLVTLSASVSSGTVNFGGTWTVAPICTFSNANSAATDGLLFYLNANTTALVIHVVGTASGGEQFAVTCGN